VVACGSLNKDIQDTGMDSQPIKQEAAVVEPTPEPTPEPPKKITIVAVGDIMFHSPQIKEAYTKDGYNFNPSFEEIAPVLGSADIAIGNLETTVNTKRKPSGYPTFNAPIEALDAILNAGFDILVTANNHSVDTGAEGIKETVNNIIQKGMVPVGTGEVENNKFAIIEKNDIKVGILAYTSSTNGIPAPSGMVNMVDSDSIKSDIEQIKDKCDFLIVYVHMGTEYVRSIEDSQEKLFKDIADAGADCVLGSHPHVARKSELYKTNGREV
jgi:poly-gamma-glutamate synthesis protein (capsule biosynthesis protein)